MANPSSLLKSALHNSIMEALYGEILSRSTRYYYFLGKTLSWEDDTVPPVPVDSIAYEWQTRNEIITMKEIKSTDVAFVVPRYDWQEGIVYDKFDDQYSTEIQGLNLISGGFGYGSSPNIFIGSTGSKAWNPSTLYTNGDLIYYEDRYYVVGRSGTSGATAPTHTEDTVFNGDIDLTWVHVYDGNGSGAKANAIVLDGDIIELELSARGIGYTDIPTVIIAGGDGEAAIAKAVVSIAPSGAQRIEDAVFYVITDEFNVYKCLDNNNEAQSTYKPVGTTVDPVIMPDGYQWKFLYNVPIALRNKFLTESYIPVISALTAQFYSNGNIQNVRIDSSGEDYSSGTITIQGDGYLEANPLYLTSITLAESGEGYIDPTLVIDPPFSNVSPWLPETLLIVGQKVSSNDHIYEVAISGVSSTISPVHKFGTVANGNCSLKYIGTNAKGVLTLDSGAVSAITLLGSIRDVTIVNPGSGYISEPSINFVGGSGSGVVANGVLQGSSVSRIVVYDDGKDYLSIPDIVIGEAWTASTVVTLNQQFFVSDRLYTVTTAGTTGTTAPNHLIGAVANGTAVLTYAGTTASATTALKYGAGYSALPTVRVTETDRDEELDNALIYFSGIKSEAKLVPIFDNGQLIRVQIDDGGVGYTYATATVTGDGEGAEVSIDLSPGDVNTLQANTELLTVDGRLMHVAVISGGYGYGAVTLTVEGDGVGAEAQAVIVNGSITKINFTNYGHGYRWARISINGNGFGAKARVIISPYGGHGRETINGLYTRTLMFYSNVSGDKNQGFVVDNDYRQLGIIKAPRQYGSTNTLTNVLASACWVISATNNTALFPKDSIIYSSDNGSRFRIVTNTGDALLVQAIDNGIPAIGTVFVNDANNILAAASVTPPSVDKYSGDLLFIDNKQAFTPTTNETVTLRTVIKF